MSELLRALQYVEWIDMREYDRDMMEKHLFCPACGADKFIGHHKWCIVKIAIANEEAKQRRIEKVNKLWKALQN